MGRVDRRRKKKKLSLWVKVLIVIGLFLVFGFGGYYMGEFSGTQSAKKSEQRLQQEEVQKEKQETQVDEYRLNQTIKITDTLSLKVKQCLTYPKVKGPKFPIGIKVDVINKGDKKEELPFKYLFQLKLDHHKNAQSIGIYSVKDIEDNELIAETMKLEKGESREVIYLFSAGDKRAFNSKKGMLTIQGDDGKKRISLTIKHQKGTVETKESSSETVIQEATTSTTYEQQTQMSTTMQQQEVQQTTEQTVQQTIQSQAPQEQLPTISQGQQPVVNAGQVANTGQAVANNGQQVQQAMPQGGGQSVQNVVN